MSLLEKYNKKRKTLLSWTLALHHFYSQFSLVKEGTPEFLAKEGVEPCFINIELKWCGKALVTGVIETKDSGWKVEPCGHMYSELGKVCETCGRKAIKNMTVHYRQISFPYEIDWVKHLHEFIEYQKEWLELPRRDDRINERSMKQEAEQRLKFFILELYRYFTQHGSDAVHYRAYLKEIQHLAKLCLEGLNR